MGSKADLDVLGRVLHAAARYLLGFAALGLVLATTLAAAGVLPWLTLWAGLGEVPDPRAGVLAQAGLTALLCLLLAFFPSHGRIMALERSHRDFRVNMDDVARAYHAAHKADRAGAFSLSSEFDQVRERLLYLRDHPDLKLLEADVLTLAAQMGQTSHRLAATYSDEKVARARAFLAQRQEEAADQQRRIGEALAICREIRRWADEVAVEEAVAASRLGQLDEELRAVLPALGYGLGDGRRVERTPDALGLAAGEASRTPEREGNVVPHPAALPAAE